MGVEGARLFGSARPRNCTFEVLRSKPTMMTARPKKSNALVILLIVSCVAATGCQSFFQPVSSLPTETLNMSLQNDVPREKMPTTLPDYVVEPPDVLMIDAVKIVPRSPYTIDTLDILGFVAPGAPVDSPVNPNSTVDGAGNVDLGPAYGKVNVLGRTVDEATAIIRRHLSQVLTSPDISVSLLQLAGAEQITGQHLVGPDGTVNLLSYGTVHVAGLTIDQTREKIEGHLSQFLESPQVTVDVLAYNSKWYYLITQGAGLGDNVVRAPITGNDMVLDAIASINGLSPLSSRKMWISRPAPGGVGFSQILAIDWQDISRNASTQTNYQLMPNDRLFVAEDKMMKVNAVVNKILPPFERIFGFTGLGTNTLNAIRRFGLSVASF